MSQILNDPKDDIFNKREILLYHGSRGGIEGDIEPISRLRCDFGRGFYLGTNSMQVKGLIANTSDPVFYEIKLDLYNIKRERKLFLSGKEWLWTVLTCRNKIPGFAGLPLSKTIKNKLSEVDIVAGPIADDRMNEAIRRFEVNGLTDIALLKSLESVDYGIQVVLKTEYACRQAEILSYHDMFEDETKMAKKYSESKREEGNDIVNRMAAEYNRQGKFLSEIIKEQQTLSMKKEQDHEPKRNVYKRRI